MAAPSIGGRIRVHWPSHDVWYEGTVQDMRAEIEATGHVSFAVRVHYDVDVGGSYGVKRGIKHTALVSYLARKLGMPVRFLEDRLENMRGGDMHGPDRLFDMQAAFDNDGTIRALNVPGGYYEYLIEQLEAAAGARFLRVPFQGGAPATVLQWATPCFHTSARRGASWRAKLSLPPPGAKGTTMRTARDG
jgi:hypothetical protein